MAKEIRLIEASFTDQEYPGLTGEDGRMLRRFMAPDNTKWYSESDLSEAMMPYELDELKQRAVSVLSPLDKLVMAESKSPEERRYPRCSSEN